MTTDELQKFLFDGRSHPLSATIAAWLAASRRFRDFAATNHTKIRKKLRTAHVPETLDGLALELETAYLLLRERSLTLQYEPQQDEHARGPDFAVSFTTSCVFMVEVTRMGTNPRLVDRFADTLCSKLGQLLPHCSNVLVVGVDGPAPAQSDLHDTMLGVQLRGEGNDSTVVHRHGFRDRAEFFRHYRRLSALLVRPTPLQAGAPVVVWVNPQAIHPLPAKPHTALTRSHVL